MLLLVHLGVVVIVPIISLVPILIGGLVPILAAFTFSSVFLRVLRMIVVLGFGVGMVCLKLMSGAARLDLHTWTHFLLFWMSFARHSIASLSRASFKMVERFNWPSFGLFPSVAVYHVQQNGLLLWSTNKIFSTVFSGTQRTLVFLACNFHVQTSIWSFDSCLGSCTVDNLSPGDTVP